MHAASQVLGVASTRTPHSHAWRGAFLLGPRARLTRTAFVPSIVEVSLPISRRTHLHESWTASAFWENGSKEPSADQKLQLANEIAIHEAIEGTEEAPPPSPPPLDAVAVSVENTGKNARRITVSIPIEAPLEAVWSCLTDYEGLADFLPGLAVCQLQEQWENGARLFQVGEQNLALGLKFKAKGVINVRENPLEELPNCRRRDIGFEMIEGDFQTFKGVWRMEEGAYGTDSLKQTVLTYIVDVKPKVWLPVRLVESRLRDEVQLNLVCVRNQVLQCYAPLNAR